MAAFFLLAELAHERLARLEGIKHPWNDEPCAYANCDGVRRVRRAELHDVIRVSDIFTRDWIGGFGGLIQLTSFRAFTQLAVGPTADPLSKLERALFHRLRRVRA